MLPFDGGPAEQAVRTQEVQVVAPDPGRSESDGPGTWRVLAPVTERGEVIGLLELILPDEPDAATRRRDRPARAPAGVRGDREPAAHRPVRVGPAHPAAEPVRGDPAPAASRAADLRGRVVHARGLAGARSRHRRRHVRLQPGARPPAPVPDRRHGPRGGRRSGRHPVRGKPAQRAQRGRVAARAGRPRRTRRWSSTPPSGARGLRHRPDRTRRPAHRVDGPGQRRRTSRRTSPAGPRHRALDLPVDLPLGLFADTHLSRQPARPGARRPDRLRHRRHARAQRRRGRPSRRRSEPPGRCTRGRRSAPWPTASSTRPATRSATTPPCCAWTGTAGTAGTATASTGPSRDAPADPSSAEPPPGGQPSIPRAGVSAGLAWTAPHQRPDDSSPGLRCRGVSRPGRRG